MRSGVLFAAMLAASSVSADEPPPLTIGQLLGQGREIAGYASGYDNRTSLILFRKPGINAGESAARAAAMRRGGRTFVETVFSSFATQSLAKRNRCP
jgi:hypothetical protein